MKRGLKASPLAIFPSDSVSSVLLLDNSDFWKILEESPRTPTLPFSFTSANVAPARPPTILRCMSRISKLQSFVTAGKSNGGLTANLAISPGLHSFPTPAKESDSLLLVSRTGALVKSGSRIGAAQHVLVEGEIGHQAL